MASNQPCAAGRRCLLGGIALGTHKCPQCRRHIHALCGVEVAVAAGGSRMNNIMCFDCQQTTTAPATTTAQKRPRTKKHKRTQQQAPAPTAPEPAPTAPEAPAPSNNSRSYRINAPTQQDSYHHYLLPDGIHVIS
jgi:hypothetical protein